jgi:hypothetical protein
MERQRQVLLRMERQDRFVDDGEEKDPGYEID